jgi:putative oxidoreductase
MFNALLATPNDAALTLLRIVAGVVMFPHGAQKALGWFGGYGYKGTMGYLTGNVGLPKPIGMLVIAAEFLGSMGLVFGLFGRVAALGVLAVMIGAVVTSHRKVGFFMNWNGTQGRGEGYEYHLLMMAMTIVILWQGSGACSLDRLIAG